MTGGHRCQWDFKGSQVYLEVVWYVRRCAGCGEIEIQRASDPSPRWLPMKRALDERRAGLDLLSSLEAEDREYRERQAARLGLKADA